MTDQRSDTPDEPVTPGMGQSADFDEDPSARKPGNPGQISADEMGGATGITGGGESGGPGEGVRSTDADPRNPPEGATAGQAPSPDARRAPRGGGGSGTGSD